MPTRRRRRRISFKALLTKRNIIIAAAVLVVLIAVILICALQTSIYIAKSETIPFEYKTQGVIIRNERLYKADVSSKTTLIAKEGAAVSKGDAIAEIYTSDYSQSVVDDLNSCEKKILDYLRNNLLKDVLNKDLDALDNQINEASEKIRTAVITNKSDSLLSSYDELCLLMKQRVDFLKEQVNEDSQLKALYDQESALMAQIDSWTKYSVAEDDGVVSYYFDGAEASLTPDNMLDLTASQLLNIQNGKSFYTLASSTDAIPLYRLVNPNDWYVAIVSPKRIEEFENKNTAFSVSFARGDSDTVAAKIYDFKQDGGNYIYYLHFDSYNENLLTPRYIELTVSCDYVGLKVPKSAVKNIGGKTGIYIRQNGEKKFTEVNELIKKDNYVCVEPVSVTDQFAENCEVFS